ncbi:anthranilate synthase component I family protein [Asaia krungthepensis]|uniref:Para-aminobenzoate synthase component I n=1 Tax=Asaia krungthepensis NRIC 0535 TaxID=1307925 RepID=A0ABQ0Q009_9PROT|nr:anthranilate synthase component I family protein [Asaia krungthepensis]GBQ85792.1 para-aminobenzoate synthase component I [Asaia krungthepensis NRIC 0535]
MIVQALDWRSPDAFVARYGDMPWSVMLDSGGPIGERARWSFFCCAPEATLTLDTPGDWAQLEALVPKPEAPCPLPFSGGVIGLASYEAGLALEGIVSRHTPVLPALHAARYTGAFVFDRQEKRLYWSSACDAPMPVALPCCSAPLAPMLRLDFTPDLDQMAYRSAVEDMIARIDQGEMFQANLTTQFRAQRPEGLTAARLYRALRRTSPAPFGALFTLPDFALLSASVERFLSMTPTGAIETRPIKGTAPLGASPEEDARIAAVLACDEKEYAENLMITDLMRNDIGRVARIGSVQVPVLCAVERFAHVHHLVSSVQGQLEQGRTALDLLRATLPPGSVTGAPKHQALKVIDQIERSARGVYCGTLFRIGADGALDSSVIIRSLLMSPQEIGLGVGCGITTLSDPGREYEELRLKAAALLALFGS